MQIDPEKCLNDYSGGPIAPVDMTGGGLPGRYYRACATPLRDLQPHEMIMLLGQEPHHAEIFAPYLMQEIRKDPAAMGGDLVDVLIEHIPRSYWRDNTDVQRQAVALFNKIDRRIPEREMLGVILFIERNTRDGKVLRGLVGEWLGDE